MVLKLLVFELQKAQSPDEAALVTAARGFGYVFTNRNSETITVSRLDEEVTYDLLHIGKVCNNLINCQW